MKIYKGFSIQYLAIAILKDKKKKKLFFLEFMHLNKIKGKNTQILTYTLYYQKDKVKFSS